MAINFDKIGHDLGMAKKDVTHVLIAAVIFLAVLHLYLLAKGRKGENML